MTRREQFNARQLKWKRRALLMYQRGWKFKLAPRVLPPHDPQPVHDGRRTPLWNGEKQKPLDLVRRNGKLVLLPYWHDEGYTFVTSTIDNQNPPHVSWTGFARVIWPIGGHKHQRRNLIGYHRRPVKKVGHKPDRMNGFQRKCWGAATVAHNEGYFPDWDPLQRHPTLDELDAGADGYSGPFPQTPRD